jgi:tRNA A-37 threonylcarbamoyl transferase component Bud32
MSQTGGTSTSLRLKGAKLLAVRAGLILLSVAAVLLFCLGLPSYYRELVRNINIEILLALQSLGITVTFYATYQTALAVLLLTGCIVAGVILFRFKPEDWVALLVAFALIGTGANAFSPLYLSWTVIGSKTLVYFMMGMILASQQLTCYTLPDGKFPQRWMRYAAIFWFLWLMLSAFWKSFPLNLFDWAGNGFTIYLLAELTALMSGIYALIYRYTHSGNPVKREQLKWVVFSIAVAVVVGVGCNLFLVFFQKINSSAETMLIANMATQTISVLAQLSVPAAMVFSILRYRLYDIELVINRSLIYGSLTVFLAAVFAGVLFGLQALFQAITGSSHPPTIGIVAATLAVFSLFRPTLQVSQTFVNRKVFGIEVDVNDVNRINARLERASHLPSHLVTSIGGYTKMELIARGGMGEIYKARHPTLNRAVAIKILSIYFKDDSAFNKRFAREADLMARLRHPNIITIYDYGEQDGLPYIVMEYLTGQTLAHVMKEREHVLLVESLPWLEDLASALDYAHDQGVIHRDIKPSNIILEPVTTSTMGKNLRAILMDFGIARFVSENTSLTASGDVLGTADYISPEQAHGTAELDRRSDLYSFAVMTYQLLTGHKPFERNNTWAMIRSHLEEPPPDPRIHVNMPEIAAEALLKALAKKPEERFNSVGEFVAELRRGC